MARNWFISVLTLHFRRACVVLALAERAGIWSFWLKCGKEDDPTLAFAHGGERGVRDPNSYCKKLNKKILARTRSHGVSGRFFSSISDPFA